MRPMDQDIQGDIAKLSRLIEDISAQSGQNIFTAFNRFLDISIEATKRAILRDLAWKPKLNEYEKAYDTICKAYAILLGHAYQRTYQDIIGGAYMALGAESKHFGQFFTPWNIACMMAKIIIGEPDMSKYTPEQPMTICDPACGSGIMLLAAASTLPRQMIDEGKVAFYGCDIDATCVQMAKLNMWLYGLMHPFGFVKPTQELTPKEIARFPEPHKAKIEQMLLDFDTKKAT